MKNRIRKSIAAAALAAGVVGGTTLISATGASAAGDCTVGTLYNVREVSMCNYAWSRTNMSPLSARGVVTYGYQWCTARGASSYATATNALASKIGSAKANAVAFGADSWFC